MTITSDSTAAVTVTRTGNGDTTVAAHGTSAITYTVNGDGAATYPNQLKARTQQSTTATSNPNVHVSGAKAGDVAPTINGSGSLYIVNNGGYVTATRTAPARSPSPTTALE